MTIFDLTFGRIISLIEWIDKFLFQTPAEILKALGLFFSLFLTGFMVLAWIKIERETKDEINYWKTLIKNRVDFYFLKKPQKNFEEIKKKFYEDKNKALIELNKFFDFVLEVFGYKGSLEEKLNKVSPLILPNLEKIKKAIEIVKIIEEKIKKQEKINLTEDEYFIIFREYEKALYNLNLLTTEDFLAENLK
jgi:hypothetical protein